MSTTARIRETSIANGLPPETAFTRIRRGWDEESAVSLPPGSRRPVKACVVAPKLMPWTGTMLAAQEAAKHHHHGEQRGVILALLESAPELPQVGESRPCVVVTRRKGVKS